MAKGVGTYCKSLGLLVCRFAGGGASWVASATPSHSAYSRRREPKIIRLDPSLMRKKVTEAVRIHEVISYTQRPHVNFYTTYQFYIRRT